MKNGSDHHTILRRIIVFTIPLIPALLFIFIVGYFNFLEYSSYHYTQFDLGINYRTLYNFHVSYHFYNWPFPPIETPQTFSKLIYVPLSFTLYLYNSPLTLLMDQILFISIGGIAVFKISKMVLDDFWLSVLIEIIYFLYPATYGFMTQGGNLMVFFEPFLLIGYYFYIRGERVKTIIFFFLASISNSLAPLIIITVLAMPYFARLIEFIWKEVRTRGKLKINLNLRFSSKHAWELVIFLVPLLVLAMSIKLYGIGTLYEASRLGSPSTVTSSGSIFQAITENFGQKIGFLNNVFQPLLYLPLMSIYAIPIMAYLMVAWYSNQTVYYDMLVRQYPYLFAGIVFISLIFAIKKLKISPKNMKKIAVLVIVSSTVSFALHSPFSVSNFQSGAIANDLAITPIEKNLTNAFELIPMNSSVLIQNDIVQLMNREHVYFPGYYNGELVQYAVFAPSDQCGIQNPYAGFSASLGNQFANNASYGIYVRLGSVEIYKLHYTGLPVMFSKETLKGTSNFASNNFSTEFITLSPGYYNLSFVGNNLSTTHSIHNNLTEAIVTMLESDGKILTFTTNFSIFTSKNGIIFSALIDIKNFDSYAITTHIELGTNNNLTFIGQTYYSISSVIANN